MGDIEFLVVLSLKIHKIEFNKNWILDLDSKRCIIFPFNIHLV